MSSQLQAQLKAKDAEIKILKEHIEWCEMRISDDDQNDHYRGSMFS
jgi:hypothetical protein